MSTYSHLYSTSPPRNAFEALRRSLRLTQEQFGKKLGISKAVVHYYEIGRSSPTVNSWARIKETAAQNGIELTEDIDLLFMENKSKRSLNHIDSKVQRMRDKITWLQQQVDEMIEKTHGKN